MALQLCFLAAMPFNANAQGGLSPDNPIQKIDNRILIDLSEHRSEPKTNVFMFLSKYNNLVNIAVPAGIFAAGVIDNDKGTRQNACYIATSSAVNLLLTMVIKKIVKRPRPFLGQIKINAVYHPGQTSFPSGHTSSSFTTATALSQVYHKWYVIAPAYLWASSVGYSRMYLGVHYPSDVATGALIGTGSALSMGFLRSGH
ncbi:phosphatase PAP2 family protein [Pedobacter lusitanus]